MVRYSNYFQEIGAQLTLYILNQSQTVDIPQSLKDSLRKFRFARRSAGSAALVIKINKDKLVMEEVEQFENISIEELADGMNNLNIIDAGAEKASFLTYYYNLACTLTELPENSPRYVVLSYELKHKDGRISFPLVLINWSPVTSETGMLTLHASALINFQATVRILLNVFML